MVAGLQVFAAAAATAAGLYVATKRLPAETVRDYIDRLNREKFGGRLDPRMVAAIVEIESRRRPYAVRYQPKQKDASLGLGQVMTATARWLGFSGDIVQLFDPETNLFYSMKLIDYLEDQLGANAEAVVQAYNTGLGAYKSGTRSPVYLGRWRAAYYA